MFYSIHMDFNPMTRKNTIYCFITYPALYLHAQRRIREELVDADIQS